MLRGKRVVLLLWFIILHCGVLNAFYGLMSRLFWTLIFFLWLWLIVLVTCLFLCPFFFISSLNCTLFSLSAAWFKPLFSGVLTCHLF